MNNWFRALLLGVSLLVCAGLRPAWSNTEELWGLLKSSHDQARKLSYEGTLFTRQGQFSQVSHLRHFILNGNEFEQLEKLEGQPGVWVRYNDRIQYVQPERKLIFNENRMSSLAFTRSVGEKETLGNLRQYYRISESPADRVAGRSVRVLRLTPADSLRYVYHLSIDREKSLILKTESFSKNDRLLEQVTFSEIEFRSPDSEQMFGLFEPEPGWTVTHTQVRPVQKGELNYSLPEMVEGFMLLDIMARERELADGQPDDVVQSVYSDGLSSVSVFVQELAPDASMPTQPLSHGAVTSLSRSDGQRMVTVMGEVPQAALRRFLAEFEWKLEEERK